MRSLRGPIGALLCLLILGGSCFSGVLFRGQQFAYRDAAHYYYPLYERVQKAGVSSHVHGFAFTSESFLKLNDVWKD